MSIRDCYPHRPARGPGICGQITGEAYERERERERERDQ